MGFPSFASGDVLTATDMNAVGWWKTASVTGTATAAINVNNCFSSSYDNYMVTLSNFTADAIRGLNIRLRVGGVDSTTTYYLSGIYRLYATGAGADATNVNNGNFWPIMASNTTPKTGGFVTIMNPADTVHTTMQSQFSAYDAMVVLSGIHQTNTAYDGLTVYVAAGNITGTVKVYGWRD